MEFIILLLVIVLVVVVLNNGSRQRSAIGVMAAQLSHLTKEIKSLKQEQQLHEIAKEQPTPSVYVSPEPPQSIDYQESEIALPPVVQPEPYIMEETELAEETSAPSISGQPAASIHESIPKPPPVYIESESWWTKFKRNNPDLEKFIGENLINKIGIAVLVLGIAFFVKYAIDQDWINEVGRVCIGIGCGALLIGLAHYMRNSYRAFSSVLAGGGLAVFYFTIALAFHQYTLFSQTAAFITMVVITAFAVVLALLYDKLELAVIAAIGGFAAPFMVSTGEGNYIVLFTYLAILNTGLLALSYYKRWFVINIISLFFTVLIFGGWMVDVVGDIHPVFSYTTALLFASLFYAQFLAMNLVNQVRYKKPFKPLDFSVLLLINALYFSAGMILLHYYAGGRYQGLFTIVIGAINLSLAYGYRRRSSGDNRLLYLLIGLTLTFASLAIPVQLHGHTITMFWAAEFVLLHWLFQRSRISLFRISSIIVMGLSLISLFMDWSTAVQQAYATGHSHLTLIYNDISGLVTNLICVAAFTAHNWLLRKDDGEEHYLPGLRNKELKAATQSAAVGLLFITAIYGVNLAFQQLDNHYVPNVYHRLVTEIFALAGFFYLTKKEKPVYAWAQLGIVGACILQYWSSVVQILLLRNKVLAGDCSMVHLMMHWVAMLVLFYLTYQAIQLIRQKAQFEHNNRLLSWVISVSLVIVLSIECLHLFVILGYKPDTIPMLSRTYGKAGLTILWALCSFVLMYLGMRHKQKTLRIISLILFAVALIKLFLFDIRGISEGGKIAAFIMLGVLLLVISFMYQKLKRIIIDDKG